MGNESILQGITVYGAPRVLAPETSDKQENEEPAPLPDAEVAPAIHSESAEPASQEEDKPGPPLLLEVRVHPHRAVRRKVRRQILLRTVVTAIFTVGCCVFCRSNTDFQNC